MLTCSCAALARISRYLSPGSGLVSVGGGSFFLPRLGAVAFAVWGALGVSSISRTSFAAGVGRETEADRSLSFAISSVVGGVGERALMLVSFPLSVPFGFGAAVFSIWLDFPLPTPLPLGDLEREELLDLSLSGFGLITPSPAPRALMLPPRPLDPPLAPRMPRPRPLGRPRLLPRAISEK